MTEKQQKAIKTLSNKELLDIYGDYYIKVIREVILDGEPAEILNAARAEILERMGNK